MPWRELSVVPVPRRRLEHLSHLLFSHGAQGLEEALPDGVAPVVRQPWDEGPLPPPPDPVRVRAWFEGADEGAITAAVAGLLPEAACAWVDVPEVDWEAQGRAAFQPLHVSPRLVIAPPWDAPPGALLIEPGAGFGTGQHETTRAALRVLDALADGPVRTVLDVGCGSGILALAAARLGLQGEGVDIDPDAVADALRNAAMNGLEVPFSTTPVHRLQGPADVVLANLYAEVLVDLVAELDRLTGRHLVLAGVLAEREGKVRAAFDPRLGAPERHQDGEWVCLHYRRSAG